MWGQPSGVAPKLLGAYLADFVFNIAKGRVAELAALAAANDALIVIPIEATGVEADGTLVDYDTVAAILAASNNEQSTMGRKSVTSATVTVDDSNNRVDVDIADQTWSDATGNAISDLLIAYDADTTGGTDANLVPLTWHDFAITPDGSDVTVNISNFYRAA
jgi:hypothetical protein